MIWCQRKGKYNLSEVTFSSLVVHFRNFPHITWLQSLSELKITFFKVNIVTTDPEYLFFMKLALRY